MEKSFLIIPELNEMVNKIELFRKRKGLTEFHKDVYLDLKSNLITLIALEKSEK